MALSLARDLLYWSGMGKTAHQRLTGWPALLVLGALSGAPAPASSLPPGDVVGTAPRWRLRGAWRQADGLPQDSVLAVLQTKDGYLWVGTRGGVARFDGVRFTTFDDRDLAQLRENEAWSLAEGDGASLWIGSYGGGITRLENGRATTFTARDGLVNDFVRVVARDPSGALWIGTDHGLSRFADGRFTSYTTEDGLADDTVRALHVEGSGDVWVATNAPGGQPLHRVRGGRVEAVALPEPRPTAPVDKLLRDHQGALWLASQDGLFRWAEGTMSRFDTDDGLSANVVRDLHEDFEHRLWVATDLGVDLFTGGARAFRSVARAGTDCTAVLRDREGSLWVGHRGRGLERYQAGLFTTLTSADGLPDSDVTSVLEDSRGSLWVGTARGLAVLRDGGFDRYSAADGLTSNRVGALAEDREGRLWVGTEAGLFRSSSPGSCPGCRLRFRALGDPRAFVRVIHTDARGDVWVGTNLDGLVRYRGDAARAYTVADGLSHGAVRAIGDDGAGGLWIGTKGGGLDRLRDGRFTRYGEKDGLPSESVQALYRDPEGVLWIATRRGLARFADGRFTAYTTRDGLYASHAYAFVEDGRGELWMTSGKGVFRVAKRTLEQVAEGKARSFVSTPYGREHGLDSTMGAVGRHPAAARTRDGRLWFATIGGLAVVDPARLPVNEIVPPVHLEAVRVGGRDYPPGEAVDAPAGRHDLVIRYTALSFLAPEKVRFRYRLEGFDREWVDADTRRTAYYTNVPPGRYRFQVLASNNDDVWNTAGAAVEMRLAPRFHQTGWFYLAGAFALALAGAATQRVRVRQLEARERQLAARVEEALADLKVLRGLLPICSACKKIRDDQGYWNQMEAYIHDHSEAQFTHGICPDCADRLYPRQARRLERRTSPAAGDPTTPPEALPRPG